MSKAVFHNLEPFHDTGQMAVPRPASVILERCSDLRCVTCRSTATPTGDSSLGAFASGLRDFLVVLDVPTVTIVGHSFGGGVAMQLAYQHPHLLDRLVLVGSGGLGREVSWLLRLLSLPGVEYVMPLGFPKRAPRRDVAGIFVARMRTESKRVHSHDAWCD